MIDPRCRAGTRSLVPPYSKRTSFRKPTHDPNHSKPRRPLSFRSGCSCLLAVFAAQAPAARLTLKSICRIKGQEENTIQGLGVIVGLKGTGDSSSYLPTIRSVAKIMSIMGNSPAANAMAELKDTKNVALVLVTATIPAAGARQGDKIDCVVSSIGSAKSLAGGRLFLTPLIGPDPKHPRVYAFAEGAVTLENLDHAQHRADPRRLPPGRGVLSRLHQGQPHHARAGQVPCRFPGRPGHRRLDQQPDGQAGEQLRPLGPCLQPGQHRGGNSGPISRRSGLVHLAGACRCRSWSRGPFRGWSSTSGRARS